MSRGERDPYSRRTLHAKSLNPNINFRLPSKKKKRNANAPETNVANDLVFSVIRIKNTDVRAITCLYIQT